MANMEIRTATFDVNLPMLNLGCGTITLPGERPAHHQLVPEELYQYQKWVNADRNPGPGIMPVELFAYPWPFADNSFAGALAAHIVEHIPHDIRLYADDEDNLAASGYWADKPHLWRARRRELRGLQDGWYAFFSELWRVLVPGATAHILVPHGHSDGAKADPTHTRYVMPQTFGYFHTEGPFYYEIGSQWEQGEIVYNTTQLFWHLMPSDDDTDEARTQKVEQMRYAMMTVNNAVYEFYAPLTAIKGD